MKKQVTVTKENREFLEKAFKVSSVMIWKALTFESDTDLAPEDPETGCRAWRYRNVFLPGTGNDA